MTYKPLILVILDGWGYTKTVKGNAVLAANTPNFDRYCKNFPVTYLKASGAVVGLPDGQMGNSEVGHLNIGAGRVVDQDLSRINKAIAENRLQDNAALLKTLNQAHERNNRVHIMGLLSDGGVHSHIRHLYTLLDIAAKHEIENVFLHLFLDGRDVAPQSAISYIEELQNKINKLGLGRIASIHGRYYAMDRDRRWDRTESSYAAMVWGRGKRSNDPVVLVKDYYAQSITDEFIPPTTIVDQNNNPIALIENNDSIIFYNFRPDRAIQLTKTFTDPNFRGFCRKELQLSFTSMTQYSSEFDIPIIFEPEYLSNTLGEVIAINGLRQLRIAETEKYPHVSYFFNGGHEKNFVGEERILIQSPRVSTYDLQPEMSAIEITNRVISEIEKAKFDTIILNFANADMVGHSGMMHPTIRAVEFVDRCLGRIVDLLISKGGLAMITADHGNAEMMISSSGQIHTAHTSNLVPLIITKKELNLRNDGILADIAPTMLDLLNLEKPNDMTGITLIKE